MGFAPVQLMHDMTEKARSLIYPSVKTIEDWARVVASGNEPLEDEVEMGAIALETLIESKVDKAFDRFTAYALRNTFKVPDGLEVVLVSLLFMFCLFSGLC
jgi:kinetochore protein Mis12/MTW1